MMSLEEKTAKEKVLYLEGILSRLNDDRARLVALLGSNSYDRGLFGELKEYYEKKAEEED